MKCTDSQIREALEKIASKYKWRGKSLKAIQEYIANYPRMARQANWENLIDMNYTMSDQVSTLASAYKVRMK